MLKSHKYLITATTIIMTPLIIICSLETLENKKYMGKKEYMEKTNYKTYVQNSNQTEWSFLEDDKLLQIDFKSFTACTKYMKKELSENLFMTDNAINQIYCVNKETGQKYNFKK